MTLDPRVASAKRSEFAIHRSNGNAYGMNLRVIVIKPDFDTVAHTQVEQQIRERAHRIEARNLRTAIKIPMKS